MSKKVIYIALIITAFITVVILVFRGDDKEIKILFYNTTEIQTNEAISIISENIDGINITYDSYQNDTLSLGELLNVNKYDLIFTNESRELINNSSLLAKKSINMGPVSSTIKKFGNLKNGVKVFPLEIDHVEFALTNGLFDKLFENEDEIVNLAELEEVLISNRSNYKYPLMIAGKDNLSLLDAISLLTLSICGNEGLGKMLLMVEDGGLSELLDTELGNSTTFRDILQYFVRWRGIGLLHPEWYRFSEDDVYTFIEDSLSAAFILRLSEHRDYDINVMKKFKAIKFPSTYDKMYATDILSIPLVAGIPAGSKSSLGIDIIKLLLSESSQKELTYRTGMAPVHSNVPAMDVQASNLRFWVASSGSIAPAVYRISENDEQIENFLNEVRSYLISNSF